jgi:Domain of unknown function (DUF4440)
MRGCFALACMAGLTAMVLAQEPARPAQSDGNGQSGNMSADASLQAIFEAKVKSEWDALKGKDKKAYAELLADDYEGVEVDGQGERNKIQALSELAESNVYNYTLWGLKVIPLGSDGAFVIYEVTLQFPPKSTVRYSRVYVTELWVKRAGQWNELHYQETHVK